MSQFKRICINIPSEIEEEIRVLHANTIAKTRKNISFSKFITRLFEQTISEQRAQNWYYDHKCVLVEL